MLRRLARILVLLAVAAGGVTGVAAAAHHPSRPFGITSLWSSIHRTADGAVQDTHWEKRYTDTYGGCVIKYHWSGQQRIDFGDLLLAKKLGKGAIVRIASNGTVTPATWTVPATATRTASMENDSNSCGGGGGSKGGGNGPQFPTKLGGCGTLHGEARLHLFMGANYLEVSGSFVARGGLEKGVKAFYECAAPPFPDEGALKIRPIRIRMRNPTWAKSEPPYQYTRAKLLGHKGGTLFDFGEDHVLFQYHDGFTLTSINMVGHALGPLH